MTNYPTVKIWPPALFWGLMALGIFLQIFWPVYLDMGRPGDVIGSLVFLTGPLIVMMTLRHLQTRGVAFDFFKTPMDVLVEDGPYKFSRNPLYVGLILAMFGFAIMTRNSWLILMPAIFGVCLNYLVIKPEEKYLLETLGVEYSSYQSRVRRWI